MSLLEGKRPFWKENVPFGRKMYLFDFLTRPEGLWDEGVALDGFDLLHSPHLVNEGGLVCTGKGDLGDLGDLWNPGIQALSQPCLEEILGYTRKNCSCNAAQNLL